MPDGTFLETFFGPGNRLSRDLVASRARLEQLVSEFDPELRRPGLLPRMRHSGTAIEWYLLAGTDDDFRRAAEEVKGFIGPTYARWDPAIATLDPSDPIDQAVAALAPGRALKFANADAAEFEQMWGALTRMRAAWAQRPQRSSGSRRPVTSVVRDIDLALAGGSSAQALEDLAELRRRGAISVQNARFIEIRALAVDSRWREIVAHKDFADLCRIRRPWDITEALAIAVNYTWLRAAENDTDVEMAIAAYTRHQSDLDQLLRVRGSLRKPEALKAVAVHHAVHNSPRESFDALLDGLVAEEDRAWATLLSERADQNFRPMVTSRAALDASDFEVALRLAVEGEPSLEGARVVLVAAYELGSLEAARRAMDYWRQLPAGLQQAVLDRRASRDAFGGLVELVDETNDRVDVVSWEAWLSRVLTDASWSSAAAVARCGELEFEATDAAEADSLDRVIEHILAIADGPSRGVLLDGLPSLLRWLDHQNLGPSITTPLHLSILEALALMDGWDAAGLEVASDLVQRILAAGVPTQSYGALMDTIDLIWERMASRRYAGWFADLAEQVEFNPGDRPRAIATVLGGLARLDARALSPTVREGLRLTLVSLGVSEALPPSADLGEARDAIDLAGRSVGIYSLSPQVLARVATRLRQQYPGLDVMTNSDHVATDALMNMARSVDLMIVAIGSAKHAATSAIEAHRPKSLSTRRHAFRGSTRIVEAVNDAIAGGDLR